MALNFRKSISSRTFILGTISLFIAGLIISWLVAGSLIAPSPRRIGPTPRDLDAESFTLRSQSGETLSGWHAGTEDCKGVVVLVHGIRGSRLSMLPRARLLRETGFATILIDLQAHGESSGKAITLGHREQHDVRASVEYARRRHPGKPIGLIGVSLGGAAALLAAPLGIDALVIESVFTDVETAIRNRVSVRLGRWCTIPTQILLVQLKPRLGVDHRDLSPISRIKDIGCPVLIASGMDDQHTTADETRKLFQAAPHPRKLWLVEGTAHEDLLESDRAGYRKHVLSFLIRHLTTGSSSVRANRE